MSHLEINSSICANHTGDDKYFHKEKEWKLPSWMERMETTQLSPGLGCQDSPHDCSSGLYREAWDVIAKGFP